MTIEVPPVILGTMTFADTADERETAAMLDLALSAGVTWIDTANVYAGGRTEELLATLLPTEGIVLATKAGMDSPDSGGHPPLSDVGLRSCLQASLTRLQRERVDVLYLHKPDPDTPLEQTVATLDALISEGLVGHYAVSNYAAWQLVDLLHLARESGVPAPVVSQQMYNPVARRLDEEYAAFAEWSGIPTAVYNPLAGGLLARRHDLDVAETSGRFGDAANAQTYRDRYWDATMLDAANAFVDLAAEVGLTPVQLALRWVAGADVVDSVILGASRTEQLRDNLAALAEPALEDAVVARVDAIGAALRGPMPTYNR